MKQIILSAVALLFLAGCGLTITPDRCDFGYKWIYGECKDMDRGDKDGPARDEPDHGYSEPDTSYSGPDPEDDDDEPEAQETESSHVDAGRGNGSEGDPDEDPGESGEHNNGGD